MIVFIGIKQFSLAVGLQNAFTTEQVNIMLYSLGREWVHVVVYLRKTS